MTYDEWRASLLVEQFAHLTPEWRETRRQPICVDDVIVDESSWCADVIRLDDRRAAA